MCPPCNGDLPAQGSRRSGWCCSSSSDAKYRKAHALVDLWEKWNRHRLLTLACHECSEGGFFKGVLTFPQDYPSNPPEFRFTSEMWHPNGAIPQSQQLPLLITIASYNGLQVADR